MRMVSVTALAVASVEFLVFFCRSLTAHLFSRGFCSFLSRVYLEVVRGFGSEFEAFQDPKEDVGEQAYLKTERRAPLLFGKAGVSF
jgi:hypothetical protein